MWALAIIIIFIMGCWLLNYFSTPRCEHGNREKKCALCEKERERKSQLHEKAKRLCWQAHDIIHEIKNRKLSEMLKLSARDFEWAVSEMYGRLGYEVSVTPYINDQGKDAIAYKENKKYLIECKRYGEDKMVGRPHLQKLYAAMHEEKADGGFLVTTGKFSSPAVEYGQKYNIELIDQIELQSLLLQAYPNVGDETTFPLMCEECGDLVMFKIDEIDSVKKCCNNHAVSLDSIYRWL